MKPVDQDQFHVPGESRGNCQQAAVASLIGAPLHYVPNFHDCEDGFWSGYHRFLKQHGLVDVELPNTHHPDCFYLVYGKSSRGVKHAVVYRAGKLVHDPHPSREGVIAVDEVHLVLPIELTPMKLTNQSGQI